MIKFSKSLRISLCLAGGTIAALLIAELIIRACFPQPQDSGISQGYFDPKNGLPSLKSQDSEGYPSEKEVNSLGFHDLEHRQDKPEGVYRILILGDSFSFVEHFTINDTWFRIMQRCLENGTNRKIEVINLGIKGAGTGWEMFVLEKIGMAYHPDVTLLAFHLGSDFFNNAPGLETKPGKPEFNFSNGSITLKDNQHLKAGNDGSWPLLWKNSHLYRYLYRQIYRLKLGAKSVVSGVPVFFGQYRIPLSEEWKESALHTELYMRRIQTLCAESGSIFLVAIIPDKYQVHKDMWEEMIRQWPAMKRQEWDMDAPTKMLKEILQELNIPFIDLIPGFRGQALKGNRLYFDKDIHWNKEGNILAADSIAQGISRYIHPETK